MIAPALPVAASGASSPTSAASASRRSSSGPSERLPGGDGRRPSPALSGLASRSRPSGRRWAAFALAAGLAITLGLAAPVAQAQTPSALVSNIGKSITDSVNFSSWDVAQGFTTGSNAGGYALTSIEVKFHTASDSNLVVTVRQGSPSGTLVATLTHPATLGTGNQTFTAPANTTLAANTTYFVVLDTTTAGGVQRTNSNSEDSGGASGWSIANVSRRKSTTWIEHTFSLMIRVNGYAKAGVTDVAIVSTPSHDTDNNGTPETYGRNEKIRVQLTFSEAVTVDTTSGTPRLSILLNTNNWVDYESGSGTDTLTFVRTVLAGQMSPAAGIAVRENTLELNGGTIKSVATQADATLAHAGLPRDANHRVNGNLTDTTAPAFLSGTVNRALLALTFDETLDRFSAPAGSAFTVSGGRTGTGTVAVFGATVRVILDSPVAPGETVTVSYTPPGSGNKLQDAAGNAVAAFDGETVTNDTTATANLRPRFAGGVWSLRLEPGVAMDPVTLPEATGGDGDRDNYDYTLTSQPAGLAGLTFDPANRRLSGTPEAEGRWTFTYTAHDGDSDRSPSDAAVLTSG